MNITELQIESIEKLMQRIKEEAPPYSTSGEEIIAAANDVLQIVAWLRVNP